MKSTLDSKLSKLLQRRFNLTLKQSGFLKHRRVYIRELEELSWVIDIQKHSLDINELEFTINCGVYVPGLMAIYTNRPEPSLPHTYDCAINARVGILSSQRLDKWWMLKDTFDNAKEEEISTEITQLTEDFIFPFLDRFKTKNEVVQYLAAPRIASEKTIWPNDIICLVYLGILYFMQGDKDMCRTTLTQAIMKTMIVDLKDHLTNLRERLCS